MHAAHQQNFNRPPGPSPRCLSLNFVLFLFSIVLMDQAKVNPTNLQHVYLHGIFFHNIKQVTGVNICICTASQSLALSWDLTIWKSDHVCVM
jgi:hypothetical protein